MSLSESLLSLDLGLHVFVPLLQSNLHAEHRIAHLLPDQLKSDESRRVVHVEAASEVDQGVEADPDFHLAVEDSQMKSCGDRGEVRRVEEDDDGRWGDLWLAEQL